MANKKLTKGDLKRMEQLSAKIAADKKATAVQDQKNKKRQKDLDAQQKKLGAQWKELKNKQKQSQIDKDFKAGVASKNEAKAKKGGGGGNIKALKAQVLEMKTKFNAEGKRARQFKQQVDQLTAENKVLQRKLKNLQGQKKKGEDPRIKHLLHENKQLKKQIKLLMIELNKKRRWFQRCIKSFKSSRQKWIAQQEDTLKKKGFLIKYVFLDDVKQIKQFRDTAGDKKGKKGKLKFRNKIKVKSRDGGVIVLKDVEIVVLDNEDSEDESGDKKGKKGKKGKKKSKGDKLDEMEAFLEGLQKEIDDDHSALGGDDYKDMGDSDASDDFDIDEDIGGLDGDYSMEQLSVDAGADNVDGGNVDGDGDHGNGAKNGGQSGPKNGGQSGPKKGSKTPMPKSGNAKGKAKAYESGSQTPKNDYLGLPVQNSIDSGDKAALGAYLVYLKKEMDDRTDDIEKMKEIVSDGNTYPNPASDMKEYVLNIGKRGDEMIDKLENELHCPKEEIEAMKANNDRWRVWLGNLSRAMGENGQLFNALTGICDYYIRELKGRVSDLESVNNISYFDRRKGESGTELCNGLKASVSERHSGVEEEFRNILLESGNGSGSESDESKESAALNANQSKVSAIKEGLLSNNSEWKGVIESVSTDFESAKSEKSKLVNGVNATKAELKELIDLVSKIPKRKILEESNDGYEQEEKDENNENENENEQDADGGYDD